MTTATYSFPDGAGRTHPHVLKVARALRASTRKTAHGRCLGLSLEMARALSAHGLQTDLVVWSVRGDKNFLDHWAVALDGEHVLDLTRVQVDGRRDVLHRLADYPENFTRPRRYPAAMLISTLDDAAGHDGRFLASRVWEVRRRMWRHDVVEARAAGSASGALLASLSLLKFGLFSAARGAQATLEARRDALLADASRKQ